MVSLSRRVTKKRIGAWLHWKYRLLSTLSSMRPSWAEDMERPKLWAHCQYDWRNWLGCSKARGNAAWHPRCDCEWQQNILLSWKWSESSWCRYQLLQIPFPESMAVIGPLVTRLENPVELDYAVAWWIFVRGTCLDMMSKVHGRGGTFTASTVHLMPLLFVFQGNAVSIWGYFSVFLLHQIPHWDKAASLGHCESLFLSIGCICQWNSSTFARSARALSLELCSLHAIALLLPWTVENVKVGVVGERFSHQRTSKGNAQKHQQQIPGP